MPENHKLWNWWILIGFVMSPFYWLQAQGYESYFTGNPDDLSTSPEGGICLMGGASEDDEAMRWFLKQASGGDILVLRASGSDGYNDYFFSELGVSVNSVETIVFNEIAAAENPYIHQKIRQAEAIWFAGGDQWKYISFWRNTSIDRLINEAIKDRNIVIGGTSAGMAIQGQFYFSAANGTIRSEEAMNNPFDRRITVDSASFLDNVHLQHVITDTHFDNPDRKGRLVTFMARILDDFDTPARAIACEEYTAVCIEPDGTARVFGGHPEHEDFAYFIQLNCVHADNRPETLEADQPLTWEQGGSALKVYKIPGTASGDNTFNLNDWTNGNGGSWSNWQVRSGTFEENTGGALNCEPLSSDGFGYRYHLELMPNPTSGDLMIKSEQMSLKLADFQLFDNQGRNQPLAARWHSSFSFSVDLSHFNNGLYHLRYSNGNHVNNFKIIKK